MSNRTLFTANRTANPRHGNSCLCIHACDCLLKFELFVCACPDTPYPSLALLLHIQVALSLGLGGRQRPSESRLPGVAQQPVSCRQDQHLRAQRLRDLHLRSRNDSRCTASCTLHGGNKCWRPALLFLHRCVRRLATAASCNDLSSHPHHACGHVVQLFGTKRLSPGPEVIPAARLRPRHACSENSARNLSTRYGLQLCYVSFDLRSSLSFPCVARS